MATMKGAFVGQRAGRTKWVYMKSVTATVSAQLKALLHIHLFQYASRVGYNVANACGKDLEMALKVTAAMESTHFTAATTNMIIISTGQCRGCLPGSEGPNHIMHVTNFKHQQAGPG